MMIPSVRGTQLSTDEYCEGPSETGNRHSSTRQWKACPSLPPSLDFSSPSLLLHSPLHSPSLSNSPSVFSPTPHSKAELNPRLSYMDQASIATTLASLKPNDRPLSSTRPLSLKPGEQLPDPREIWRHHVLMLHNFNR